MRYLETKAIQGFCGVAVLSILAAFTLFGSSPVSAEEIQEFYVTEPEFGASIRVLETGKHYPDTVVLVHGLGDAGSDDWRNVIPALSKQYHVVALDLPGFAKSEKGNHLYSPTRYAHVLKWLVDHYTGYRHKRRILMVGHSLGGATVLRYASIYPETLKKLIIVDAAGILHRSVYMNSAVAHASRRKSLREFLGSRPKEIGQWLGELIISSENIRLPVDAILNSSTMRSLILRSNPSAIAALALLQENFGEAINGLEVPTSIIWGANDGVAPLRTGRLLHARIKGSSFDVIRDSGHVPMNEKTSEFNRMLRYRLSHKLPHQNGKERDVLSRKRVECISKDNMHITGTYQDVVIKNCKGVKIEDMAANSVYIKNSEVDIYNSRIISDKTAMVVKSSKLSATVLDVKAETAISTASSRLDLASVNIESDKDAVISASNKDSVVLFSVSKFKDTYLHGIYKLKKKGQTVFPDR